MEEQVKMLQNIGLQEYQAKAFAALLARSESTATDIAEISGVPLTKLYAILKSLEDLGFLKSSLSRPKLYRPIDVKSVIEMMIAKKQEKISEITKRKEDIVNSLSDLYNGGKKYETPRNLVWAIHGPESGLNEIAKLVLNAKKNLYTVSTPEDWKMGHSDLNLMRLWIDAVIRRNVHSKEIMPTTGAEELKKFENAFMFKIKSKKSIQSYFKGLSSYFSNSLLEIREMQKNKIHFTMIIADSDSIVMNVNHPSKIFMNPGLVINDKTVVNGMIDYFISLWNMSKPVKNKYKNVCTYLLKRMLEKYDN